MRGGRYCYVHSFGRVEGVPWYKNLTLHSIVGLVISLGFGISSCSSGATKAKQDETLKRVDEIPRKTIEELERSKIDARKIYLGERYAYEFDNYLGATNEYGNESRIIDPERPLHKKYDPGQAVKFVPRVVNGNTGIPFEDVSLQVVLPDGVEVVSADSWIVQRVNKRYSYFFPRMNNTPLNTGAIAVKFPHPGPYELLCTIDGRGIDVLKKSIPVMLYE
jgi:hypothetical protein